MRRLSFILLVFVNQSFSQTFRATNFGLSTGLVLNFGTHVNSFGLFAKAYYTDYFYQLNIGTTQTWNLKSYGNRRRFWESRNYLGVVFLGGKKDNIIDFQLDGVLHQTGFRYAIGYNYLWYFDHSGTTQRSGGWGVNLNKVGLYFENDIFAGQGKDRFRTGHLMASFRYLNFKFATGAYLWTGETRGTPWVINYKTKCPYGYKDLSSLPFGKTSHGILYGSIFYSLPYGQSTCVKIGIDSDNVRNGIQNKLIHDLIFLPKSVEHKTPHYPCLNKDGFPVFEKSEVRKDKLFIQTGLNEFM